MGKFIDLSGQTFNRLTVVEKMSPDKSGAIIWKCECVCGNIVYSRGNDLRNGHVKSCGCYRYDKISCKKTNPDNPRLYNIYNWIKRRCYNKNHKHYNRYGGRGILMCDEWKDSYINFYNWAIMNRYNKNLTIDRINNGQGYSPDNCRWATRKQQSMNRDVNIKIKIKGEYKTPIEVSKETGININTIYGRRLKGMSDEEIINTIKKIKHKSNINYKKTQRGLLVVKYEKYRKQHEVNFTLEEFLEKFLNDKLYLNLFKDWIIYNYEVSYKPTLSKIDNKKSYTLDNIMILTVRENNNKRWNKGEN